MPINRAGMLEAPINRNPPRPPGLQPNFLGPRGVASDIENVKVLPGENVPVAIQKRTAQMFRQRFGCRAILRVVGVNRIVVDARTDKVVVAGDVQIRTVEPWRRNVIHPQGFDPGVPDVSRVRRARHVAEASGRATTIAGSQELPLLEGEMRQLINPDEQELRALILVDVALVAAITEPRGRAVFPGNDVL